MSNGNGTDVADLTRCEGGGVLLVDRDHAGGTEGNLEVPRETSLDDVLGEAVELEEGVLGFGGGITLFMEE